MHQIEGELKRVVAPYSLLISDGVRALKCFCLLNEDMHLYHFIIKHSTAKDYGFSWKLWIDNSDGGIFSELKDDQHLIYDIHTNQADGEAAQTKKFLTSRGGSNRKRLKAELKERQYRHNNKNEDLYECFMDDWGILEKDLYDEKIDMEFLENLIDWDWHVYDDRPEFYPTWACPGCDFVADPENWKLDRKNHKKTCKFYETQAKRTYEHEKSRCVCCVHPYHDSNKTRSSRVKATRVEKMNKKGKKKKRRKQNIVKVKKCPNPKCPLKSVLSDTSSSWYQHRMKSRACRLHYEKQRLLKQKKKKKIQKEKSLAKKRSRRKKKK